MKWKISFHREQFILPVPANQLVLWKIAGPMIGLGIVLAVLGGFAAWNIHVQQTSVSDEIVREVHRLETIAELSSTARNLRYQIILFLRTKSPDTLQPIEHQLQDLHALLAQAEESSRQSEELRSLAMIQEGVASFEAQYPLGDFGSLDEDKALYLCDDILTQKVLEPIEMTIRENERTVDRMSDLGQASSRQLVIGLLLLGLTGGAAGILVGIAVARGVGRSMVQLDVSVQSVAKRIPRGKSAVSFTHLGDLGGIESNLRFLEQDIIKVVSRLQEREYELLKSEQLARVGQMAAGLAHELRNPLMPMKMLVQAALNPGSSGLDERGLEILNDEIQRLEEAIASFLDFARPRVPVLKPVDIVAILNRCKDFLHDKARSLDIQVDVRSTSPSLIASVDEKQLWQVLLNIANNAMEAMSRGGVLTMDARTVHHTDEDAGRVAARSDLILELDQMPRAEKDWLVLQFLDTGPGFSDEAMQSIFEPFYTTKDSGTGLGLYICEQIAKAHQGVMTVNHRADRASGADIKWMIPWRSECSDGN